MPPARRMLAIALALCVGSFAFYSFLRRPEHALLVPAGGAEWIRSARPFELFARFTRDSRDEATAFRTRIEIPSAGVGGEPILLHVNALRAFRVFVDYRSLGGLDAEAVPWRNTWIADLSKLLAPGSYELRVEVVNDRGAPALMARIPALGVATGPAWQAQLPNRTWAPAQPASARWRPDLSNQFPSAWQGLRASAPLWLAAFGAGFAASFALARRARSGAADRLRLRPGWLRTALLLGLALLGVHNLWRLDIEHGFDARDHLNYIRHVANTWRAPLATEGWQTFQPPLFYFVAAPVYRVAAALSGSEAQALYALRALTFACALGLLELVYRAARTAFPEREDLQNVAVATGGLLPMSVYMAHYVGNEPFAALLTAGVVLAAFRLLREEPVDPVRRALWIGMLFGLSLIAKITSVLLLPLLLAVLLRSALRRGAGWRAAIAPLASFALSSVAVAGWYFVRNRILLGHFYIASSLTRTAVSDWDPSQPAAWNQDPGYRVPEDLLRFGDALSRPIYAAFSGLWDGIYSTLWLDGFLGGSIFRETSPPWNYDAMVACALLALPLTLAAVLGGLRALRVPRDASQEMLLFSAVAVALYVAAILAVFLRLPIYSTVKASYTLGLAPCYGVLIARGFDLLPRQPLLRAGLAGWLAAWVAVVFRAYWI